jgi:hypothetical protein
MCCADLRCGTHFEWSNRAHVGSDAVFVPREVWEWLRRPCETPAAGLPKRGLKVTFDQFAANLSPLSKSNSRDANRLHSDNMIVMCFPEIIEPHDE